MKWRSYLVYQTKYRQLMGDDADEFFAAFDQPVQKARVNPLKLISNCKIHPQTGKCLGVTGVTLVLRKVIQLTIQRVIYSRTICAISRRNAQPQPGERVPDAQLHRA